MPPGLAQWAVLTGLVIATAFTLWALLDCLNEPEPRQRLIWMAVILVTVVFGAAVYFLVRRPRRRALYKR